MDNDAIRSSGSNTIVEVWLDGRLRSISVSRGAIEAYLESRSEQPDSMSDEDRCEFVRANLPLVMAAARSLIRDSDPAAERVSLDAGQLGGSTELSTGDRRKGERRKGERRKLDRGRAEGDRRRGERRKGSTKRQG